MRIIMLVAVLCLPMFAGCEDDMRGNTPGYRKVVPPERQAEYAAWVAKAIADANPKSDEEPEDWIHQAQESGLEIFGVTTKGLIEYGGAGFTPYDKLSDKDKKRVDDRLGK